MVLELFTISMVMGTLYLAYELVVANVNLLFLGLAFGAIMATSLYIVHTNANTTVKLDRTSSLFLSATLMFFLFLTIAITTFNII